MTYVRLAFYGLYVVLGVAILARMIAVHSWGIIPGVVLGLALTLLGAYRLMAYFRTGALR